MAGMGLIEGQLGDTSAWRGGGRGLSAQGGGQCGSERRGQTTDGRTAAEGTALLCRVASSGQFGRAARARQAAGTVAVWRRGGPAGLLASVLALLARLGLLHTCHLLIRPHAEHAGRAPGAV